MEIWTIHWYIRFLTVMGGSWFNIISILFQISESENMFSYHLHLHGDDVVIKFSVASRIGK